MNSYELDSLSREKIENNINTNYFVEAGAGSGKTTVLVKRMLKMVKEGREIEKICAITFTRAAASEFYERFQLELSKDNDPKCKEALKNLDLCFMGTIDAFCNMILSEHPSKANIPSDARMIEKDEAIALYNREYTRILNGEYGEELLNKAEHYSKLFYNHQEIFINILPIMIGRKNIHFNYSKPIDLSIEKNYQDKKERIINIITKILNHKEYYQKYYEQKQFKNKYDYLENNIDILNSNWDENINDIITYLKYAQTLRLEGQCVNEYSNLTYDFNEYFTPHESRGKLGWHEVNINKNVFLLEELNTYKASIILDFINACVNPISKTLKKEGRLSFDDYLLGLRDLLKEDSMNDGKLIKHIYDRHSYFLIDEFQDTNPLQAEIFFYLTAKKPKKDWKDCIPKEGSLFIVGDPKQSIYRFRSADVSSYLRVKDLFKGEVGEVLSLTRNFRSRPILCDWFNKTFEKLLSNDSQTQSKYNEIPIEIDKNDKKVFEGIYKYNVLKDDGEIVADIISKLINNKDYIIYDSKQDIYKEIEYKDIMVITPSTSGLDKLMNELSRYNIPSKVEGYVLFDECPSLKSVKYLMTYLNNPNDKRSKFVGEYLSACDLENIDIKEYVKTIKDYSPSSLFQKIIDDFNIFECVGIRNVQYLYFALELIREKETKGEIINNQDCLNFIDSLFIKNKDYERTMQLDEEDNRVYIANLHKVKGLERPIVILAKPSSKKRDASIRIDYLKDEPQGYFFNYSIDNISLFESYENLKEKELEEKLLNEENDRLLYVAATRARNALIVADKEHEGETLYNPWFFFTENIHNNIYDYIDDKKIEIKEKEYFEPKDYYNDNIYKLNNNDKSYIINLPSKIKLEHSLEKANDLKLDNIDLDLINDNKNKKLNPTLVGSIIHRYMELIILSKDKINQELLIKNILNEFDTKEEYYYELLKEVNERIHNGGYKQDNGLTNDILNELLKADEVFLELPFCHKLDDYNIWHGVIDVVYKKDNKWHIIDYKTNADPNLLDEKYKGQLDAYINAFKTMTNNDVDAFIYHIDV